MPKERAWFLQGLRADISMKNTPPSTVPRPREWRLGNSSSTDRLTPRALVNYGPPYTLFAAVFNERPTSVFILEQLEQLDFSLKHEITCDEPILSISVSENMLIILNEYGIKVVPASLTALSERRKSSGSDAERMFVRDDTTPTYRWSKAELRIDETLSAVITSPVRVGLRLFVWNRGTNLIGFATLDSQNKTADMVRDALGIVESAIKGLIVSDACFNSRSSMLTLTDSAGCQIFEADLTAKPVRARPLLAARQEFAPKARVARPSGICEFDFTDFPDYKVPHIFEGQEPGIMGMRDIQPASLKRQVLAIRFRLLIDSSANVAITMWDRGYIELFHAAGRYDSSPNIGSPADLRFHRLDGVECITRGAGWTVIFWGTGTPNYWVLDTQLTRMIAATSHMQDAQKIRESAKKKYKRAPDSD